MNDTFDIKRFGLVFKKLLFEKSLNLIGSFVLVSLLAWSTYHFNGDSDNDGWYMVQPQSFMIGLILGGIYWVSVGFSYFSDKTEGYGFLTLPASHLEKWFSVVVLACIFLGAFCLFFRAMDAFYTSYFLTHLNPNRIDYKFVYDKTRVMPFWGGGIPIIDIAFAIFLVFTGIMAVGSVYFNKMALVKTMFAFAGIILLLQFLNSNITSFFFEKDTNTSLFWSGISIRSTGDYVNLPKNINQIFTAFYSYLLPIILWLIALVRLREKEM
jgi:hypothetical protein